MAIWLAFVLSMVAGGQGFVALLAAQTGAVPILPQRRLSLSEIDRFLALWAVGHDDWCTKRTKALSNPSERQLTVTAVSVSECRQAS